ncbi:MAG: leucine-rich repeat domain-containing protein [Eubacterium sp.]|nr:leucine-rich repeat domain-containing protein [Eubacterium sp.]
MNIAKQKIRWSIVFFIMAWMGFTMKVPAAEVLDGAYQMEEATALEYETDYYTYFSDSETVYFKFKTLQTEGVYVLALNASWEQENAYIAVPNLRADIYDNYKRTVDGCVIADGKRGSFSRYRGISLSELEPDQEYFLKLTHTPSTEYHRYTGTELNMQIFFIPFQGPQNVSLSYDGQGHPVLQWSCDNAYNTYSSLTSYDYFQVESSVNPDFTECNTYIVEGSAAASSFTDNNPKSGKMYYRVVGCQKFYYPKDKSKITLMQKKSAVVSTEEVKKGSAYTVNNMKYKVTDDRIDGNGTVTLTGTGKSKSDKNFKTLKIGATVKIYGRNYKITAIANKAFKNYKKLTSVTIGSNVGTIGKESFSGCTGIKSVTIGKGTKKIMGKAFYNCKKLSKINIKSQTLSSVGSGAFKNIYKKAVIKVPSSKLNLYRGLFGSRTGYRKTMKLKKR